MGRVCQRGPRVSREQAGGDAWCAEQQAEPVRRHSAGAHLAGDAALAFIQFGEVAVITTFTASKVPYRGLIVILATRSLLRMEVALASSSRWPAICIWTNSIVAGAGSATLATALRASEAETVLLVRLASSRTYGARMRM